MSCPLEHFCVCGHAWWAHLTEVGGCYARTCECGLERPAECTCPEISA